MLKFIIAFANDTASMFLLAVLICIIMAAAIALGVPADVHP